MNPEKLEKLKFLQNNRPFLGREYLTWLWFASESRKHIIDIPGYEPFELHVNDKLVISSSEGTVREHCLKGGSPAYAKEAKSALRTGKLVNEANFVLKQGKSMWTWSMKAEDFAFRSLRLPNIDSKDADAETYMRARIEHTETIIDVHKHLYQTFLKSRLSKSFRGEAKKLADWAEKGAQAS